MSQDYDEFEFEYTKVTKTTRVVNPNQKERKASQGNTLLYGKDLSEYANIPIEDLLNQLTEEELEQLSNEVDPDDPHIPPDMRCKEQTKKKPTGPLDRQKLMRFLKKYAAEQEDWPENKPFEAGMKRGKVFIPKEEPVVQEDSEDVILDVEEENARSIATDADIVDLAGILGFHSMLNQEQYYAAITGKGQVKTASGFQSIAKGTVPKIVPALPDNDTNVSTTAQQVADNDPNLKELNWNNIKHIPRDTFKKLFDGLKTNTHLQMLSISNTGLTDGPTANLVASLKNNKALKVLNLESNFISGPMIKNIVESLNGNQTILEFRASNQRPQILGNRVEMAVAKLLEKNTTLLRLGLNFDVPDARMRVAQRLQTNNDNVRLQRIGRTSSVEGQSTGQA